MKKPQEQYYPFSNDEILELKGCASRASGLLHLLAVALVKSDVGTLNPPTHEEAEGITWLAMHTSNELNSAFDAAFGAPPVTLPTTAVAAR
jgi:hypothetical protein